MIRLPTRISTTSGVSEAEVSESDDCSNSAELSFGRDASRRTISNCRLTTTKTRDGTPIALADELPKPPILSSCSWLYSKGSAADLVRRAGV
jgi:hypothetical protein